MRSFSLLFLAQTVSLIGSQLTSFALGIWVYETTGEVTPYALIFLFTWGPQIIFTPFAGVFVDRWDRRKMLLLSDAGAGLGTLALALLYFSSNLAVWHIYLVTAVSSLFSVFQLLALPAAVTLMVPKEQLGRASGMLQFGRAGAQILAPAIAGLLMAAIGVGGVILIDFATFLFAVVMLFLIRIPPPLKSPEEEVNPSMRREAAFGFQYLWRTRGLLALAFFFFVTNFSLGMVQVLITPLVLGFSTVAVLGTVLSLGGVGMLAGGGLMAAWGGPRKRIRGILLLSCVQGLALFLGGLRPNLLLVGGATFAVMFCVPLIAGSSQVVWQRKVAAAYQGRVFAARHVIASASQPLAYVLAGPLTDDFLQPALREGGFLHESLAQVIGSGEGRGAALLLVSLGLMVFVAVLTAVSYPPLRQVEEELPDAIESEPVPA